MTTTMASVAKSQLVTDWSPEKMKEFDITIAKEFEGNEAYSCNPVTHGAIKGTNTLVCNDTLIMGGDRSYLYISLTLMTVPTFCFIVPAALADNYFRWLSIPPLLMWLVMTVAFFLAGCIDPGIIPRDLNPPDTNPETVLIKDKIMYRW
jgi:hypothetical protein